MPLSSHLENYSLFGFAFFTEASSWLHLAPRIIASSVLKFIALFSKDETKAQGLGDTPQAF